MNDRRLSPFDQYRQAAYGASHASSGHHEPNDATTPRDEGRGSLAYYLIGVLISCVSVMAIVYSLFPPDGVRKWWGVGGGVVAISLGVFLARSVQSRATIANRVRYAAVLLGLGFIIMFAVGLRTQLVLNGSPTLSTSAEARAHEVVADLYEDIKVMSVHDELLAMDQPDARSRYNSYEPAARELRTMANKWSRLDLGRLPDPELIAVVQHVKTAATFGAEALDLRYILITEPDDRLAAALRENRAAFFSETLAAGAKLKPLADRYQVAISPTEVLE